MITTVLPDDTPVQQVRGDSLLWYLPLVHVGADGRVTGPLSAQDCAAFDARWTGRRMQIRADPDDAEALLTTVDITVMSDPALVGLTPGMYIRAPASDTAELPADGSLYFDLQLDDGTPYGVWTITSGRVAVLRDVTRVPAP